MDYNTAEIAQGTLQLFEQRLSTHKKIDRGVINRFDWSGVDVPSDVARVLTAVGGWSYGDFSFVEPAQLDEVRRFWTALSEALEAGRSESWEHTFWNPAWYVLAQSSVEVHAYDPIGCFGGTPGQVVSFDVKGGDSWYVFTSINAWLGALAEGFEGEEKGRDPIKAATEWARSQGAMTRVKLPEGLDELRSPRRFQSGVGNWTELRHADGRAWAIRERRDGYELRIGDGDDAIIRKRRCPNPGAEVRKLIREQKAEGFAAPAITAAT
jgi:hypothetical protein